MGARAALLIAYLGVLCSCANSQAGDAARKSAAAAPIGETKQSAIEVCMPLGEQEYLSRLLCDDGRAPAFQRRGNVGNRFDLPKTVSERQMEAIVRQSLDGEALKQGEVDYHVVDMFELNCGGEPRRLFLDMYHCRQPPTALAPKGLTLRPVDRAESK